MKRLIIAFVFVVMTSSLAVAQRGGAPPALTDSGPGVPLVKAFLDAYNKRDVAAVQNMVSTDIVFMDDDGHTIKGKEFVNGMLQRRLTAQAPETISTSGAITSNGTADVIWAGFPYNFKRGDLTRKGLMTMVFRKAGNDWQVVHFQFAIDAVPANSLDRR
jgi:ketosteroid isomerase-like protein